MKKLISVILLSILLLNTTFSFSSCNNYSSEGLVFELSKYNPEEYGVKRYTGNAKNVLVPAEYEGLPVTRLEAEAFKGYDRIKKLHLPATIDFIVDSALIDCPSLSSIIFDGTMQQWNEMKHWSRLYYLECVEVTCSDGKIEGKVIPSPNSKTWEEREKYDVFFSRLSPAYDVFTYGIVYNYENENIFPDEGVESTKSSEEPKYDESKLNQVIDEAVSRLCNVDGYIFQSYEIFWSSISHFEGKYWYYVVICPTLLKESTGETHLYMPFTLRVAL